MQNRFAKIWQLAVHFFSIKVKKLILVRKIKIPDKILNWAKIFIDLYNIYSFYFDFFLYIYALKGITNLC